MDESERTELEGLRRRAYGRDATAGIDAEARERLRLLEGRAEPVEHAGTLSTSSGQQAAARAGAQSSGDGSRRAPASFAGRLGGTGIALWAVSIVATGLLVFAATVWATGDRGREVGELQLREAEQGADSGFGDALTTDDFYGLTVIRTEDSREFCLLVFPTDSADGGLASRGCTAGSFPAVVQMTVAEEMPAQLVAEFREGTGLRFSLDGETVKVQSDSR